jgi:adenine-specific DNA-methyltransferase
MSKKKVNGEVFTPKKVIDFILDKTYSPENITTILEPGCGDGRIIVEIIKRIISYYNTDYVSINNKIQNITGVELDFDNFNRCVDNIKEILSEYKEIKTFPNIIFGDVLLCDEIDDYSFDYIVGNPPYVRIHNLDKDYLVKLQNKYHYLKNGMVDLYYAFFELFERYSTDNTTLVYITPNTFLYNTSAEHMVNDIYYNKRFNVIYDFKSDKLFEDAATYTAITILKKNSNSFEYKNLNSNFEEISSKTIEYNKPNINLLNEIQDISGNIKFSDKFKVKVGFATLLDNVFVITDFVEDYENNTLTFVKDDKEWVIELSATKKCIKASKYNGKHNRVIYPYYEQNGKVVPVTVDELFEHWPQTYYYLITNEEKLNSREKGKIDKSIWYQWGRSQGLNNTKGKKIVISPIYEKTPFIFVEEDTLIYSGYYIIVDNDDPIFKDESFLKSLRSISKNVGNGWFSLQKKILDNVLIN